MTAQCPCYEEIWVGQLWARWPCSQPADTTVVHDDGTVELMCEAHAMAGQLDLPFFYEEGEEDSDEVRG